MKRIDLLLRLLFFFTIGILVFASCNDDKDDYIPYYEVDILENQPDTTYGDLSLEIVYDDYDRLSAAPAGTRVNLYRTSEDLAMGIPMYEFEIRGPENIIYAGYLLAGTYYVLAYTEVGFKEYEGTKAVQVIANNHRGSMVTMYHITAQ